MKWNLINKFLSEECTKTERDKLQRWLREDPKHQKFFETIQKIWEVDPKEEAEVDVRAAWRRFQAEKLDRQGSRKANHRVNEYRQKSNVKWYHKKAVYAVAASLFILLVAFFMLQKQLGQPSKISYQQVQTAKGQKTNLKLSDGTRIKLNSESSIKIPSNYGKENRTLYLSGEAFFKVAHDASKPFRVYAGGVYTKDVGTQFNVKAFAEDNTVEVVVAEGKVALGKVIKKNTKPIFLSAHERAVITGSSRPSIQMISNLSSYIGWVHDDLVFNDTPFRVVVRQLERWYDVDCIVKNKSLLHQKLTATFKNEPLSNVLQLIAKSMDIEANRNNQQVIFTAKMPK